MPNVVCALGGWSSDEVFGGVESGVDHRQGRAVDVGDIAAVCEGIARRIGDTRDQGGLEGGFINGRLPVLPRCDGVGQRTGVAGA